MFTVYKTTNLVSGNFYLGCHKTLNPNDEYLGSGRQIEQAIKKHGRQNFKKEVLFSSGSSLEAFAEEQELIAAARNDRKCYNMHDGGYGGWDYVNRNGFAQTPEAREKGAAKRRGKPIAESTKRAVAEANRKRIWDDTSRKKIGDAARIHRKGKPRPLSVKLAVGAAARRRAPRRWICKDGLAVQVLTTALDQQLANGWHIGRI